MANLTPDQRRTRERVEALIGLAAPALNLMLAFGDRLSRVVEPEDSEYYPVRSSITESAAADRPPAEARPTRSGRVRALVGKEDPLQWERKWAPAAAVSAFVAALLPLAGSIWTQSLLGSLPTSHSEDAFLRQVHSHSSAFVGAGVLTSIGTLFLSPAFAYLYRATRARRPQIPKIALFLLLLAPLATPAP